MLPCDLNEPNTKLTALEIVNVNALQESRVERVAEERAKRDISQEDGEKPLLY